MIKILAIFLLLLCNSVFACELGKTYKDFHDKPDTIELKDFGDGAFYFPNGRWTSGIFRRVFFDENDMIAIYAGDEWNGTQQGLIYAKTGIFPKLNYADCPYILYKGHRWYPNYHGTIYVYKDGREVK